MPVRTGFPIRVLRTLDKIAAGGIPHGNKPVAQIPIKTQGTHTTMMHNGCATRVSLNAFALRAVSQCWKRWGNIPTLSGINM